MNNLRYWQQDVCFTWQTTNYRHTIQGEFRKWNEVQLVLNLMDNAFFLFHVRFMDLHFWMNLDTCMARTVYGFIDFTSNVAARAALLHIKSVNRELYVNFAYVS